MSSTKMVTPASSRSDVSSDETLCAEADLLEERARLRELSDQIHSESPAPHPDAQEQPRYVAALHGEAISVVRDALEHSRVGARSSELREEVSLALVALGHLPTLESVELAAKDGQRSGFAAGVSAAADVVELQAAKLDKPDGALVRDVLHAIAAQLRASKAVL